LNSNNRLQEIFALLRRRVDHIDLPEAMQPGLTQGESTAALMASPLKLSVKPPALKKPQAGNTERLRLFP
jgi:hypothetical protein